MAYSGAWKNSPAATNGEQQRTTLPRENWGTGVDPRHDVETPHDMWTDVGFPAPVSPPFSPALPPYIEDQFNESRIPPTASSPQDLEPKGHEGCETAPWGVGDWRSQNTNNIARSKNYGSARAAVKRHQIGRDYTQQYDRGRYPSLPAKTGDVPTTGQAIRALRGKNALDLNNPGSPEVNGSGNYRRQGMELVAWANRRMPRKNLTHTKRLLHLNLAATAVPSTPGEGEDYSPYSSPFAGRVTTGMIAKRQTPMMRREPRMWDEDTVTDGTDQTDESSQFHSWGL